MGSLPKKIIRIGNVERVELTNGYRARSPDLQKAQNQDVDVPFLTLHFPPEIWGPETKTLNFFCRHGGTAIFATLSRTFQNGRQYRDFHYFL